MSKPKPLVGITTDLKNKHNSIEEAYAKAVVKYGGLSVLLPTLEHEQSYFLELIQRVDGLLIPGSRDMDPHYYDQEPHPKLNPMNHERTEAEFIALEMAVENNKPVLGICGGMQFINVFYGGSLYQDIPALIDKPLVHEKGSVHPVEVKEGSWLHNIIGEKEINVKSYHHQAVHRLGKDLAISAVSPDGIIEGLESEEHSIVAVQWHPELEDTEISKRIFEHFIKNCLE